MKRQIKRLSFLNSFSGAGDLRGLGPVVSNDQAEMYFDMAMGMVAIKRKQMPGRPPTEWTYFHPGGIAMVFEEETEKKSKEVAA
jgi:hypothetical protein